MPFVSRHIPLIPILVFFWLSGCGGEGDGPVDGSDPDLAVTFPETVGTDKGTVGDACEAEGTCVCVPDCTDRVCGDNGCGGSCGTCYEGKECDNEGHCVVMPLMDLGDGTLMDPGSGLVWQEIWVGEWDQPAALSYCEDNQAGLSGAGWRIPDIDELRTIVRGCPDTGTDGACAVGKDCLSESDCWHGKCAGCDEGGGQAEGCYWDPLLVGKCGSYWSSSTDDTNESMAWYLDFDTGGLKTGNKANPRGLRCVR